MLLATQAQDESRQSMAEEVLRRNGSVRMRVFGHSMLPSIWPGDVITVESRPASQVAVGDIALLRRDRRLFVHRVKHTFSVAGTLRFETRGDSAPQADPLFYETEVLGKLTGLQRSDTAVPLRGLGVLTRVMGWIFCHCDRLQNLALRLHAVDRRRGLDPRWEMPDAGQDQSSILVAIE